MKLIIFLKLWTIFILSIGVEASTSSNIVYDIASKLEDSKNYSLVTNEYEIYGNYESITEDDFYNIVTSNQNKVYVHYSTKNYYQEYDLMIAVNNSGDVKFLNYTMSNENKTPSIDKFKDFICFYSDELLAYEGSTYSTSNYEGIFNDSVSSNIFIVDFAPYGYITARVYLKEYSFNDLSSLFIVNVNNTFVPGAVAKENKLNGYESYKNSRGFVHMKLEQAYDAKEEIYGRRYGATPYFKDYWPVNVPSTITIASSFGEGPVIGYSQKDGFMINGNLSYDYSKSVITTDPVVNAQLDNSLSKVMWSYTYNGDKKQPYDQDTNILYEISKSGNELFYGDVRLKLDYNFVVDKGILFVEKEKSDTIDLIIRPSQKRIYKFF